MLVVIISIINSPSLARSRFSILSRSYCEKNCKIFDIMVLQRVKRNLYSTAVGLVAGATVGLVGWGRAQVIIPAMTLPVSVANFLQMSATGISLTSLSVSTVSSAYTF
jgi:hypothetical protein